MTENKTTICEEINHDGKTMEVLCYLQTDNATKDIRISIPFDGTIHMSEDEDDDIFVDLTAEDVLTVFQHIIKDAVDPERLIIQLREVIGNENKAFVPQVIDLFAKTEETKPYRRFELSDPNWDDVLQEYIPVFCETVRTSLASHPDYHISFHGDPEDVDMMERTLKGEQRGLQIMVPSYLDLEDAIHYAVDRAKEDSNVFFFV